ncbi:uncharacterized protein LOC129577251 [Sitodiplosis mosellana]|uniref:uncharacterized protein LOC129577251 n=1 Tax=Sitodiplosis mosellana TaxID=263140 RepID=UPI002443AB3D|nr:uncharacterized protein LOC129577251 [Sitodiplosis mosellana]
MSKLISTRRKTIAKSRYTLGGYLLPTRITQQRIYEPTYQLTSNNPTNFDHIQLIIRNCLIQNEYIMPSYDPDIVMQFVRSVCNDIKFRIQIQNFDRFRAVVIVNVTEKANQGLNWQVGTLLDSSTDGWTTFQHETATYMANVFCSLVYWD